MKKIVITADVFRIAAGDDDQIRNAFLLHELVSFPIFRATGIVPEINYGGVGPCVGASSLKAAYREFGLEPTTDGWSRIFWSEDIPSSLLECFEQIYSGYVVVCFEMPPIMENILNKLAIPWVNICLSPLRFLPDLLFDFTFSAQFQSPALSDYVIPDALIGLSVAKVRDWAKDLELKSSYHDSLVFFAQSVGDRTLIQRNGFIERPEVIERIHGVRNGRRLFVKRHPWANDNPLVDDLIRNFDAEECHDNSYVVLASHGQFEAMSISSSVSREAPYFGKTVSIIHPEVIDLQVSSCRIMGLYRTAKFWRRVFENVILVTPDDDSGLLWHHNLLRMRIGTISLPMSVWAVP